MAEKTNPERGYSSSTQNSSQTSSNGNGVDLDNEEATKETVISSEEPVETKIPEIDWKTQAAYYAAELDNMRKRFQHEAGELRKYANEDLLKKVVPVLDTLTLALQAADKAKSISENDKLFSNKVFQGFIQGVDMTAKQFESVLQSAGIEFIKASGQTFDPLLHEAIGQVSREGVDDNKVVEEFSRGFKLGGRVVRPAKVMVNVIKREQI